MKNLKQQGFILLFAVLLVSIVLTVTLVLLDITLRQLVLSATSRESQRAYYAAHGGIDCAIYWDRDYPSNNSDLVWPLGKYEGSTAYGPDGTEVVCGQADNNPSNANPSILRILFADGSCAQVEVEKQIPVVSPPTGDTIIVSYGYNLGSVDNGGTVTCPSTSGRLVERALRTTYNDNWK